MKAKRMTVARLHKQLGEMVENGQGWMRVCVDKTSFQDPCEADGAVILNVTSADFFWIPFSDDEGGIATRKDGTERGAMCFVLDGGYRSIAQETKNGTE